MYRGFVYFATILRVSMEWTIQPSQRYDYVTGGREILVAGVQTNVTSASSYILQFYAQQSSYESLGNSHIGSTVPDMIVLRSVQASGVYRNDSLLIIVPPWPYTEGLVYLTLLQWNSPIAPDEPNMQFTYIAAVTFVVGFSPPLWNPPSEFFGSYWQYGGSGVCSPSGSLECRSAVGGGTSLTVVGTGFQSLYCPSAYSDCELVLYTLQFIGRFENRTASATPLNASFIIFQVPAWSHEEQVTLKLLQRATVLDTEPAPFATLTYVAEYSAIHPNPAALSGPRASVITVIGAGFDRTASYLCILSRRNATGYAWLPEERAQVTAAFLSDSALLCNTSALEGWFPSYPVPTRAAAVDLGLGAAAGVTDVVWERRPEWGSLFPSAGSITFSVLRSDEYLSNITLGPRPLLIGGGDPQRLVTVSDAEPDGLWWGLNFAEIQAQAGLQATIRVSGLPGFWPSALRALEAASPERVGQPLFVAAAGQNRFPGVLFNIFSKRGLNLTGIDVFVAATGPQTLWIFLGPDIWTASSLTTTAPELGGSLERVGWSPANGNGTLVDVNDTLVASVEFSVPVRVPAGSTLGVLVVGSAGLRYSWPAAVYNPNASACCSRYANSRADCCGNGCGAFPCDNATRFDDAFASISKGRAAEAAFRLEGGVRRLGLVQEWGDSRSPRFFAGVVRYFGDQVGGQQYRLKLSYFNPQNGDEYSEYSAFSRPLTMSSALLSVVATLTFDIPPLNRSETYPFCVGGAQSGSCPRWRLGLACGGVCRGGGWVSRTGTCTGVCLCNVPGWLGRSICSGGAGSCSCKPPNAGYTCSDSSSCTGPGAVCEQLGLCVSPLNAAVESVDGRSLTSADGSNGIGIYAVWTGQNISTTSARGGEWMQVHGLGFDRYYGYKCSFVSAASCANWTAPTGQIPGMNIRTDAVWISSTSLLCKTPAWYSAAASSLSNVSTVTEGVGWVELSVIGMFDLFVRYAGRGCQSASNALDSHCCPPRILVIEAWESVSPSRGYASGGALVALSGFGYSIQNSYYCYFSSNSTSIIKYQNATFINSSTLVCTLPSWNEESLVEIELFNGVFKVVNSNSAVLFSYEASWNEVFPNTTAILDQMNVTVSGYGFVGSQAYFCSFRVVGGQYALANSSGELIDGSCTSNPSNPCAILCVLSMVQPIEGNMPLHDSLFGISIELGLFERSGQSVKEIEFDGESGGNVIAIFSSWSNMLPASLTSSGGSFITLFGSGFNRSELYLCRFTGAATSLDSVPRRPEESTRIVFSTPPWGYASAAEFVTVTLILVATNATIPFLPAADTINAANRLQLTQSLDFVFPSTLPVSGVAIVTFVGAGFETDNNSYLCSFSIDWSVSNCTVEVINHTHIRCSCGKLPLKLFPGRVQVAEIGLSFEDRLFPAKNKVDFTVFFVYPASLKPILFVSGVDYFKIPQGVGDFFTLFGADPSPYSYVGFTLATEGCQSVEFKIHLANSSVIFFYNNWTTFGRIHLCYSTDGADGHYFLQDSGFLSIPPSFSNSIRSINFDRVAVGLPFILEFKGIIPSNYSRVLLSLSSDCVTCEACVTTAIMEGPSNSSRSYKLFIDQAGNYSICYSTMNIPLWTLQTDVRLEVIEDSRLLITSFYPMIASENFSFAANISGLRPSRFSFVALSRGMSCAEAADIFERQMLSSRTDPFSKSDDSQANLRVGVGLYSICISTCGSEGPYKEQMITNLTILAAANNESISVRGWPGDTSGLYFVVEQQIRLLLYGIQVSIFSFIAFSKNGCDTVIEKQRIDDSLTVAITFRQSGRYSICFSTDNGETWYEQLQKITIIQKAGPNSINSMFPSSVAEGAPVNISLSGNTEIFSLSSAFRFVDVQSDCNNFAGATLLFQDQDMIVSTVPLRISMIHSLTIWPRSRLHAEHYKLCFSTNESFNFQEQFGIHLIVIPSAETISGSNYLKGDLSARAVFGLPTSINLFNTDPSPFSYVGPSESNLCNVSQFSLLSNGPVPIVTLTLESMAFVVVCYSTTGNSGPYFPIMDLHVVANAKSSSITGVRPSRISAYSTISLFFEGADFSESNFVALSREYGGCNDTDQTHVYPLKFGNDSQANAITVILRNVGAYFICYSTDGMVSWELQSPNVTLVVTRAVTSSTLRSVQVCERDAFCSPSIFSTCSSRTRVAAGSEYYIFFDGVDFSETTQVALTNMTDSLLGGIDCSQSTFLATLNLGIRNQSCATKILIPDIMPGEYHICLSTSNGLKGSWLPKGDDRRSIILTILPKPSVQSIVSVHPSSAPVGFVFNVTIQGADYSDFTWIAFTLTGCNNTTNYTKLDQAGPIRVWLPLIGLYKICYRIGTEPTFYEQTTESAKILSLQRKANYSSISMICAQMYDFTSCSGEDGILYAIANAYVRFSFLGISLTPFSYIAMQTDSNCSNRSEVVPLKDSEEIYLNARQGIYFICFGDESSQPFLQDLTKIEVVNQGTSESISSAYCLDPGDGPTACIQNHTFRVGLFFQLILIGSHSSPFSRISLCYDCTQDQDCAASGDVVSIIGNYRGSSTASLSFPLRVDVPGIYSLCYQVGALWQLQISNLTKIYAIPMWEQAILSNSVDTGIIGSAGGDLLTFSGTGFLVQGQYFVELLDDRDGYQVSDPNLISSAITVNQVVVETPRWYFRAAPVRLVLRELNYGPILGPEKIVSLWPQVTKIVPSVGDKLGGEALSVYGFGFNALSAWTTQTVSHNSVSYYCEFQNFESGIRMVRPATIESPLLISCVTPCWSLDQWIVEDQVLDYVSVRLLFNSTERSGEFTCLACQSFDPLETSYNFAFRKVNKPPNFVGFNINTWEMSLVSTAGGSTYIRENWTGYVDKGGTDEIFQSITFEVTAFAPSFFASLPSIIGNGTLLFTTSVGRLGTAKFNVVAKDNGGGNYRSIPKNFTITILPPTYQPGEFLLINTILVFENSGPSLFDSFANPACFGKSRDFLSNSTANIGFQVVASNTNAFQYLPYIDIFGSLTLQPANNWNGDTTASVRCVSNGQNITSWATFIIKVVEVNQAPSFVSLVSRVQVSEASSSDASLHTLKYATNISANDFNQSVTFHVVFVIGNHNLLKFEPTITSDGLMTFYLNEYENGNATLAIFLMDDGGVSNGGENKSLPAAFILDVLPVNQPPSFKIPQKHLFLEKDTDHPIYVPNFATYGMWQNNFAGPEDERYQTVSFNLFFIQGSNSLFSCDPTIFMNGTLFACLRAFQFGYSVYNVTIVDDGDKKSAVSNFGPENSISQSSLLILEIQNVNTAPTVGIPKEIYFWNNPYEYSFPPRMLVRDYCEENCLEAYESKHPRGDLTSCCPSISMDNQIYSVPAKANFSAGPNEEYQNVTFTVFSARPSLLFAKHRIISNGTFLWKLRPGQTGSEIFTIVITDDGGTSNNGSNINKQNVTVTVLAGYVKWDVFGNCSRDLFLQFLASQDDSLRTISSRIVYLWQQNISKILVISTNAIDMFRTASALQKFTSDTCRIGKPEFIAMNGNSDVSPRFDLYNPPIVRIDAFSSGIVPVISSIQVDSASLIVQNEVTSNSTSSVSWSESLDIDVTVLRYRMPASDPQWIEGRNIAALFRSVPRISLNCSPRCLYGSLVVNVSGRHGLVDVEINLRSQVSLLKTSRRLMLVINPSFQPPYLQESFLSNLTLLEDNGIVCIKDCVLVPKIFNLSDIFGDINNWFDGSDILQVKCNDSSRLVVELMDDVIIFTPQLHQHGVFSVDVLNSVSMPGQPLLVIIKHINHPPFSQFNNISILKSEDDPPFTLNLEEYIMDVDTTDQNDPFTTVDVLTWHAFSNDDSILRVSVHGSLCVVQLVPHQYTLVGVNITVSAKDSFGSESSIYIRVFVEPVPDIPFQQRSFSDTRWSEWTELPSYFCENQERVSDSISKVEECKQLCLNHTDCTSITFYADWPHCFLTMGRCQLENSSFSDHAVSLFARPIGIVVNESSPDLFVDIQYLFGDFDSCDTLLHKINCTYDGYPLKVTARSSDVSRVFASCNQTVMILHFVRHSHTYYRGFNEPVVVTLTATNANNLSFSIFVNVTLTPVPNAPIAFSLPPVSIWQDSNTSINISSSFYGIFHGNLSVCDQTEAWEIPGLWVFFDCDQLTFDSGDPLMLTATSKDPSLFSVELRSRNASLFSSELHIMLQPGQFGEGSIEVRVQDRFGAVTVSMIWVKVRMINAAPAFSVHSILHQRSSTELTVIPNFLSNVSLGLHKGDKDTLMNCYSGEDCCNRPPVRISGDCWGFQRWGQNLSFDVLFRLESQRSYFEFSPYLTMDKSLVFQLKREPSELTGLCNSVCFSQIQIIEMLILASDDGGTDHGGDNATIQYFNITIIPDYPPYFHIRPTITVLENNCNVTGQFGLRTCMFVNFVSPSNLSEGQIYSFLVQGLVDNSNLVSEQPVVDSAGALRLKVRPDMYGHQTFKVILTNRYNKTRTEKFDLIVKEVNLAPHFCSVNRTIFIEQGLHYNIPHFFNISTGGSACSDIDVGDCAQSVCGYNRAVGELGQILTFSVEFAAATVQQCSLFDCSDYLFQGDDLGWIQISPNGDLNISACNYGQENVTIILRDSGGTSLGGQDTTIQKILVNVSPINRKPHFELINNGLLFILEDSKDTISMIAKDVSPGRCEESTQTVTFMVQVISPGRIFSYAEILQNGTTADLEYALIPNANGVVAMMFSLTDGSKAVTKNMTIVVLAVNDAPDFRLAVDFLQFEMDTSFLANELVVGITSGPADEATQSIHFGFKLLEGPVGLVDDMSLDCSEMQFVAPSPWMGCLQNSNGSITISPGFHRFGKGIFELSLFDNGSNNISYELLTVGTLSAPHPVSFSVQNLTIQINYRNLQPQFSLSTTVIRIFENSGCISTELYESIALDHCNRSLIRAHRHSSFAVAISKGSIFEDANLCPDRHWLVPSSNLQFSCVNQTVTFTVSGRQGSLFEVPPKIFEDGSLIFKLAENQIFPSGIFRVVLTDSLGVQSEEKLFGFEVISVNSAPFFSAPRRVVAFENVWFLNTVVTQISAGINEFNQQISFQVLTDKSGLFKAPPIIYLDGSMSFTPFENTFGSTFANITLTDDGGTRYGGRSSFSMTIVIDILQVQTAPNIIASDIYMLENEEIFNEPTALLRRQSTNVTSEDCISAQGDGSCSEQQLTFVLLDASNPMLFSRLPTIDENLLLSFEICKDCSGTSQIFFKVFGSGYQGFFLPDCVPCNADLNSSILCCFDSRTISDSWIFGQPIVLGSQISSISFTLFVEPSNTEPEFATPWNTLSGQKNASISCPALESVNVSWNNQTLVYGPYDLQECRPVLDDGGTLSRPRVQVLENSGSITIQHFASSITSARGYSNTSIAILTYDSKSNLLQFRGRREDEVFGIHGMEFSHVVSLSPDRKALLAVGLETNTLAYWDVMSYPNQLRFHDSRSNGELRLRFGGWTIGNSETVSINIAPIDLNATQVCGLSKATLEGEEFVFIAGGCDLLNRSTAYFQNDTYKEDQIWRSVVGHWDFTSGSMYTTSRPMKISFLGNPETQESVSCDSSYCKYRRSRNVGVNCIPPDSYSTDIAPATFRDEADKLGAAVILGVPCALGLSTSDCCKAGTEWDVPKESSLSATNFLVSADGFEAVQFDDFDFVSAVTRGFYISYTLDGLVDGNPSTSILPLGQLSIEVWFTVGDISAPNLLFPLVSTLQQASNCQKGWALSWFIASGKFSLYFDISLDMSVGCRSKVPCSTSACSLMKTRCAQYGDGVGAKSVFVIPTANRPSVQVGQWFHAVATYDGRNVNLYLNNVLMSSTPACDGNNYCGDLIYAASYHTCPQFCTCPASCPLGNCPCGGPNQTVGGISACPSASPITIGAIDSSAAAQGNAGKHRG